MDNMYPHYGTVLPRDQGVAAAQLYYGQTSRGIDQHFHEPGYGYGVAGLYEHQRHHPHRAPVALGSGPLDPSRVGVLRAADAMLPHSHLARTNREDHLRPRHIKDERYMNLYASTFGTLQDSRHSRHMTPGDIRYHEAQKARTGMSLVNTVSVSPRSFI